MAERRNKEAAMEVINELRKLEEKGGKKTMEDKYKTFTMRIDEDVLNKLNEICEATGLKKQAIACKAIKRYIESLEQTEVIKVLSDMNK